MTRATNFDPRWARRGEAFVVVADGGTARILKRSGRRFSPVLLEIARLERSSAHRHARDLTTDHEVEVERFARQLAVRLVQLARAERVEELVLIAAPRFLGVLRRELPEPIRQHITREVPRDLTGALPQPIARAAFELPAAAGPSA